jgi:pteridine reductase
MSRNVSKEAGMAPQRVAVVTGSGKKRVGWYVADALAARGYALVIHYHRSVHEAAETVAGLQARGVEALSVQADLGDEKAVHLLLRQTLDHFGHVDALVHCAATWQSKPLESITAEDLRYSLETNTVSTFLCGQLFGLAMVGQPEGGCIITLGDWAIVRPYQNYAAYLTSKGAIPTLTRTLAVELGVRNPRVRVNCILPGPVLFAPETPEEQRREAIRGTLVQRAGTPQHVAQAALALIDNDFITGVCLPVDGGRSVYAPENL